MHGPQQEGGAPDPVGQGRAIQVDALAGVDLGLPVERKVVGVLGDEHLGDGRLGRQAALDQPRRRGRLDHDVLAGPAGILRPAHHQHPELRRHDVEPLGDVLADPMQHPRAARAGLARDVDHSLDPRQVGRQGATVRPALCDPCARSAGAVSSAAARPAASTCSASSSPSRSWSSGRLSARRPKR